MIASAPVGLRVLAVNYARLTPWAVRLLADAAKSAQTVGVLPQRLTSRSSSASTCQTTPSATRARRALRVTGPLPPPSPLSPPQSC